jgi:uncharacterized membrane protein YgcG
MAEHIDWTEQAGEAVLVQTEDVLDSIQRLRAEAQDNGYLEDNAAQLVETAEEGTISIAPANPEVIYVPTYDTEVVYSSAAPGTPYYVSDDDDWGDALAAGAIFFGSAIILDEIFDNDDWGDYWDGPGSIDWDNKDFSNNINIDRGDINIDRDRTTNIDRDNININRGDAARLDPNRPDRDRPGSLDRDQLDRQRDKSFKPDAASRDAAKAKIENRKARGEGVASMPAPNKPRTKAGVQPSARKPSVNRPTSTASSTRKASASAPKKVSKPKAGSRPTANKSPQRSSAMKKSGGSRASAASSRGHASRGGGGRSGGGGGRGGRR